MSPQSEQPITGRAEELMQPPSTASEPSGNPPGEMVNGVRKQSYSPSSLRRRVFDLAWPVIGENFLQTMLGIVDTLMVAQLGTAAIAGVGASLQVMFFVISALSAVSVGSAVLVAQAVGGRSFDRAAVLARQSLVWSVIISIPLAAVGLLPQSL
ncbi:MAG: MATE family efflux transporter [Caldilineaceae bacterium]